MPRDAALAALADRWRDARPAELANFQLYITELCEALGVEKPRPAGTGYEFELPVRMVNRDGTESHGRVDLFKEGRFLLEAKHDGGPDSEAAEIRLRRAFGQAANYAAHVPGGPPPYLMVLDVGRTLRLWDRWSGSYGGFQGVTRVIDLTRLADNDDDARFLRLVWTKPGDLDPRAKTEEVTKEIAGKLAELAARLETGGEDGERVARFLIRCVFTMFAEDVGLLKDTPFLRAVEVGLEQRPEDFESAVADLWAAMDEGKKFGHHTLLRFNGHFFHEQDVLPLSRDDLAVLLEAARADWSHVEPSIFGTLLTRALDPVERHRLGAEFTPRAYVERLVRPTIEEPVRERWTMVQAEVLQLREKIREAKDRGVRTRATNRALKPLQEFHKWLRSLRILDPACGSGNFLYVSLNILKEIELEVFREIEEITGQKETANLDDVGPAQFHGIEVKPWAREVAELCLWVGYHQWWVRTHGHTGWPEPVLRDTGTLECRDAVLAWDEIREDPDRSRPDPTPRIEHPVTGEMVPDPEARLPYYDYVGARQAEWPEANFIVGNPPYMGKSRVAEEFGEGYVTALRAAYPQVPPSADYVMYWWHKAAELVAQEEVERTGLITTNSIVQTFGQRIVAAARERGTQVIWAIADHPWVDDAEGAAVRVAMTVTSRDGSLAERLEVDDHGDITKRVVAGRLNDDLSAHADVPAAAAVSLLANEGMASNGYSLYGAGFILDGEKARELMSQDSRSASVLAPYLGGKDLTARPRDRWVIDFGLGELGEAQEHPVLFDVVRSKVKPARDAQKRASRKKYWWRFGEPCPAFRDAREGLSQYIATPYVAKHRFFVMLDRDVAPDHGIIWIALHGYYALGVLSSKIHVGWALAAGGRLGVGNDPRYNNTLCFQPFPFPNCDEPTAAAIANTAERLHEHRAQALARDESVTMTGMYNVVEKLRSGEPLTEKQRKVHEIAACGVLRDLHDELDRIVADAYGWPWPMDTEEVLARLVALHDDRVEEERRGLVRWLRPDYQIPRFGDKVEQDLLPDDALVAAAVDAPDARLDWPDDPIEQLSALRGVLDRPLTVEEAAGQFKGAGRSDVENHLAALEVLGVVAQAEHGKWQVRDGKGVAAGAA